MPLTGTPSQRTVIEITGTGIVSSWNPAAVLLYGYPAEEIVGHPANVLCPPEGRAGEAAVLQRITAGGPAERYEADRVRKDGTRIRVSLTAEPVTSPAGVIVGVTAVPCEP
ncbi:MAG: domain S-box protein, partial [Actinomycetia bacterium]|nr:domain S-box protein [Actinomycetes bacterium]